MVTRYATLTALAAVSIWALITVGASNGQWLLADAGQNESGRDASFWLLAAIALAMAFSLVRFLILGRTHMVDGWYQDHKKWIYTILGGGLLYAAYHLV
jgi:hypothetical protein